MWLGWMAHQRESPVAVDDIALERSASDAHNKLLENREYCIIFRALALRSRRGTQQAQSAMRERYSRRGGW